LRDLPFPRSRKIPSRAGASGKARKSFRHKTNRLSGGFGRFHPIPKDQVPSAGLAVFSQFRRTDRPRPVASVRQFRRAGFLQPGLAVSSPPRRADRLQPVAIFRQPGLAGFFRSRRTEFRRPGASFFQPRKASFRQPGLAAFRRLRRVGFPQPGWLASAGPEGPVSINRLAVSFPFRRTDRPRPVASVHQPRRTGFLQPG